jgi:replication factor C subunit 1
MTQNHGLVYHPPPNQKLIQYVELFDNYTHGMIDTINTVALCGDFENEPMLRSVLAQKNITVKVWSPHIHALIVGENAKHRWKYNQALKRNIRIVYPQDFLQPIDSELWVDKYKPKKLSDVIGHISQMNDLIRWLKEWKLDTKEDRSALVTGPPGIGKTTAVHLIVHACGYDTIELNASNERSASAVRKWFEEAANSTHMGTRRVVIMDEVDGMSSGDRGGVGELARIIKTCTFPIICIANERNQKLTPLVKCSLEIRFNRPTKQLIAKSILSTVIKQTGLHITQANLEELCEQNGNDIRQILNFLQFHSMNPSKSIASIGSKDPLQRVDAFSATGKLFGKNNGNIDSKSNLVFVDYGLVPLMVGEGYIAAADKGASDNMKLECCVNAANSLGMYDILDNKIHKTQNWSLLPSSVMMVVSAATEANGPAPFQIFPSMLGKISKTNKHKRWLHDMRRRGGFPCNEALIDSRELLRTRLFTSHSDAKAIVDDLIALGLTRDDMMDTLAGTIFTGDEDSVSLDTKLKSAVSREWKKRDIQENRYTEDDDCDYVSDDEDIIEL